MIETKIRDYLISTVSGLSIANCFLGNIPAGNTETTFAVVSTGASPLSDSHNSLASKLSAPKGIKQNSFAISIEVQSDLYDTASDLIWAVFSKLGAQDGGCIVQGTEQMYITPVESPYHEKDITFKLNFIVRTTVA